MSRTSDAGVIALLGAQLRTFAEGMKITRTDGEVFGFSDHYQDKTIDGVVYLASSGFFAKTTMSTGTGSAGNTEVDGYFTADALTREDVLDGKWDDAEVVRFQFDWSESSPVMIMPRRMRLGTIRAAGHAFTCQLLDLGHVLNRTIGRTITPFCAAELGDAKCGVDMTAAENKLTTTIAALDGEDPLQTFSIAAPGAPYDAEDFFSGGVAIFNDGGLAGRRVDILKWNNVDLTVRLLYPIKRTVAGSFLVGDSVTLLRGCAHDLAACVAIQGTAVNFRGFPHKPSPDRYTQFGQLLTGSRV